ncbi:MAG TPA: tetratricopeptide repeat protein [Candidatus Eremiobacteraceae bacterium]|nr:tetratricopeptide repeat protein [Candidatus Eremiobacteraceae bacterium]
MRSSIAVAALFLAASSALVFVSAGEARARTTAIPPTSAPTSAPDPGAQVATAKSLMNTGRPLQAIALLEPVYRADPSNRDVAVALAQAYSYTGAQGKAIAVLDAVLAKDPTDGEARVLLGRAYAYNHDYADAEAQFTAELKANAGDTDAQVGLADTYTFASKYADAEKLYRAVLAKDPKNGDARVGLAAVESYTNRLSGARADYEQVLAAQPTDVDALVGLASVAYWEGDLATAQSIARRAVALAPEDGDALDILRQVDLRIAPLTDVTAVTTTGSDGLERNLQLVQRFYSDPATYFGLYAARYSIAGGGVSTSADRIGVVAGYSRSAAASFDLRADESRFIGQAATTDMSFAFSGSSGLNDYGASLVYGGVDGSIAANGGVPVLNGQSAVIRLTTLAVNGDHRFGRNMAGVALQSAYYSDGNTFRELDLDVNRTQPLNFANASLVGDINYRDAGFANSYSYSSNNLKPPYNLINHSHGYYDYLAQRDATLALTYSERVNDHVSGGVQLTTGTRTTTTFYGPTGATGIFRLEPYITLDTTRMTFSVDDAVVRYSGGRGGLPIPYSANTLQLNVAIRL